MRTCNEKLPLRHQPTSYYSSLMEVIVMTEPQRTQYLVHYKESTAANTCTVYKKIEIKETNMLP